MYVHACPAEFKIILSLGKANVWHQSWRRATWKHGSGTVKANTSAINAGKTAEYRTQPL